MNPKHQCFRCGAYSEDPDNDFDEYGHCEDCVAELEAEQEARDRIEETK